MENPNLKEYKYSVIVLIYHRSQDLVGMTLNCLGSVFNAIDRNETEIILVDNGSTVRHKWEDIVDTYIRFNENKGISRGWNAGLRLSRGKYKVILGDDVVVRPNFLQALQKAMDMPECGVANIHVEHLPADIGCKEHYRWFSGACFMLTQNTIDKVGYFDESIFPCNTEDWDYWLRTYQAGLKLYRNFAMSIQHKEGQTVHAPDLSKEHQRLMTNLRNKYGFDPTGVFCGEEDIYEALGLQTSG